MTKWAAALRSSWYRTAGGAVDAADVIIDAVFGFSFHGRLPSVMEPLFARAAENKKAFHISVDIPSGAVCDTGAVEGACFKADHYGDVYGDEARRALCTRQRASAA